MPGNTSTTDDPLSPAEPDDPHVHIVMMIEGSRFMDESVPIDIAIGMWAVWKKRQ